MGAILMFLLLIFLPGAIAGAFKVIEVGFEVVAFVITAALTVILLVVGFVFVLAQLAH